MTSKMTHTQAQNGFVSCLTTNVLARFALHRDLLDVDLRIRLDNTEVGRNAESVAALRLLALMLHLERCRRRECLDAVDAAHGCLPVNRFRRRADELVAFCCHVVKLALVAPRGWLAPTRGLRYVPGWKVSWLDARVTLPVATPSAPADVLRSRRRHARRC